MRPFVFGPPPHGAERVAETELLRLDRPARVLRLWCSGWNTADIGDRLRIEEPEACRLLAAARVAEVEATREGRR